MAQVAACQRGVGVATLMRPRLVEMRGGADNLTSIAWMLGRRGPTQGQPMRLGWGWWLLDSPHRALALEDPASAGQVAPFLDRLARRHCDVAVIDTSDAHVGLIVAGRLARPLVASAAARLPEPAIIACHGDEYRLLVMRREVAEDTREVLLEVGRSHGAVAVGNGAAELHRAVRRVDPTLATSVSPQPSTDTTTTGALSP